MIIRKKLKSDNSSTSSNAKSHSKRTNVIKKEDAILDTKILDTQNVVDTNEKEVIEEVIESNALKSEVVEVEEFEKIDISSIEFKERVERRRGDRRRGYRRIDERSLVSRAQQEAHTIKELAAREGYQNGLKKAQDEVREIKASLADFISLKDEMYENIYPHIVEVALAATKKIIKKEVELSNDILKEVIISTLDELNNDIQRVEIKVNPDDFDFASASLPEFIEQKGANCKINVVKDETIAKGSCVVVANNGVIDANFTTQLAVLQSAFGIYEGGL